MSGKWVINVAQVINNEETGSLGENTPELFTRACLISILNGIIVRTIIV